ncbi:ABC transporter substrate-binding protein [Pseudomonas chengduensis]|jgi:dipeptide transport system substrate-binding protein|uniref:Dipeptide transport system substrate-binding protein n=1 Tax=Ectopseudomonas chengduensis TaxID=489632 RepID=A0A1G6RMX6_9GAMM|nr:MULTISPECIES: ABC transporter substrate-binding protein [Pseudomonas]KQO44052.1 peptide ABC transporter substrate-binding protein [Pseudomonas sp. Leaf83]MBP3062513.1 ABC transporter substrate-binding protein [Pseudomonas chengduensis]MDH1535931.1 ABC transporter substrate-binding protein [Pseudomonas chengduensis]NNB75870.1 ABC transporter substrate-binding protein [Pseudomonas chengduensis]SDD05355.1 dipeptide transport system substrate-binding protein [Pseudomonas chengduensis]
MPTLPLLRGGLLFAALLAAQAQSANLVVCSEASPEGFDIVQYTAATTADATAETLFERLVAFAPGSTEIVPALAESWEIADDGLSYTFTLRKGVKFHANRDFTPSRTFNADDVLWSFQRQLDPAHPWHKLSLRGFPYAEAMGLAQLIERVEKLDEHRVRFVLKHPEAPFLANLAMGFASIYSAEYADHLLAAGTPERLNNVPIGTGPFIFERYAKDAQVRFRGNPDYWGGAPKVERLILAITPEPNVRQQRLKAGDCQIALYPRPVDIPALKADPQLQVLELDSLLTAYIGINTRHPPLDDVRVRQALNLAFDKAAYIRAQYGEGNATPAVAPYPATLWGQDETLQDWPHDPERARQLLTEAGHADGFALSIWTRPGGGPTNPNPGIGAQMLQADLAAIGIRSDIRVFEWGELIKRAKNGEHDLVFMGWAGDNGDPDNFLTPNLSCAAAESGENQAGWCDKAFDALITQARREPEQSKRAALYRQALAIFHEQAPWIALAHPKQFAALRKGVEGFVLSPMGSNNYSRVNVP